MRATPTHKSGSPHNANTSVNFPLPASPPECHRVIDAHRREIGALRGQIERLQREIDQLRAQAHEESERRIGSSAEPAGKPERDSTSLRATLRAVWQETCSTSTHRPVDDIAEHRSISFLRRVLTRLQLSRGRRSDC